MLDSTVHPFPHFGELHASSSCVFREPLPLCAEHQSESTNHLLCCQSAGGQRHPQHTALPASDRSADSLGRQQTAGSRHDKQHLKKELWRGRS